MSIILTAFILGASCWLLLNWRDRKMKRPHLVEPSDKSLKKLTRYDEYLLSGKERVLAICMLGLPIFIVGYVFYKSLIMALLLSTLALLYPKYHRERMIRLRKNKLNVQFKQALSCLSSSLSAGKSVESAFWEALEDLRVLYPDPSCFIVHEFGVICRRLENGEPIEAALIDFSQRACLEDAASFTDVFVTCKRTGGNLIEVMKRTSVIIGEKLEIKQDILVMVAQKRFESRVLLLAPVLIVALLSFSSPEYMEPLYKGVGAVIMTICLLLLGACGWLTHKIMNIKV
jgi:tight adherence protein B